MSLKKAVKALHQVSLRTVKAGKLNITAEFLILPAAKDMVKTHLTAVPQSKWTPFPCQTPLFAGDGKHKTTASFLHKTKQMLCTPAR